MTEMRWWSARLFSSLWVTRWHPQLCRLCGNPCPQLSAGGGAKLTWKPTAYTGSCYRYTAIARGTQNCSPTAELYWSFPVWQVLDLRFPDPLTWESDRFCFDHKHLFVQLGSLSFFSSIACSIFLFVFLFSCLLLLACITLILLFLCCCTTNFKLVFPGKSSSSQPSLLVTMQKTTLSAF